MSAQRRACCAAMLTDPGALRATATVQLHDAARGVVRETMVVYAVSPRLANAAEVLTSGLCRQVHALKALA